MKPWVVVPIACVCLVGCFNQRFSARMAKMIGKNERELVAKWGYPNRIEPDGRGGRIFIYGGIWTQNTPATTTATTTYNGNRSDTYIVSNPGGSHSFEWYRKFWLDANGIVYDWAWLN